MSGIPRRALIVGMLSLSLACLHRPSHADDRPKASETRRLALKGHDPVSYFTSGRPEQGSPAFKATFDDAEYWFKDSHQRDLFVANPDRYAPQYGGFCAIMVSRGGTIEPDPNAWSILEGKLYVFAAREGMTIFQQQATEVIDKAGRNWPELHRKGM